MEARGPDAAAALGLGADQDDEEEEEEGEVEPGSPRGPLASGPFPSANSLASMSISANIGPATVEQVRFV